MGVFLIRALLFGAFTSAPEFGNSHMGILRGVPFLPMLLHYQARVSRGGRDATSFLKLPGTLAEGIYCSGL